MREEVVHDFLLFKEKEQSIDIEMIRDCQFVAKMHLVNHPLLKDNESHPSMYIWEAAEGDVMCSSELFHIIEGMKGPRLCGSI